MIKACLFDLDGTLADTVESIAYSANMALNKAGLPSVDTKEYNYFAGDGAKTLIERAVLAAGDTTLEKFHEVFNNYLDIFKSNCNYNVRAFEGIREVLAELKNKGIKLGVISNKPHPQTVSVVESLFGKGYFDFIQGQSEKIPKKPNPAGARMAAEFFRVSPECCMYIGDTNVDMQTGNNAGMLTVGVLWGFRDRQELETNNAHHIIGHPDEILSLLSI